MRKVIVFLALAIIILAVYEFYGRSSKGSSPAEPAIESAGDEEAELKEAENLVAAKKAKEALLIIQKHRKEMEALTPNGKKWITLYINASVQERDIRQLSAIYEFSPESFKDNEEASLLVAKNLLSTKNINEYNTLRAVWKDRETNKADWIYLDADAYLISGHKKEAQDLLESNKFQGEQEISRLVLLSTMTANDNPKAALDYLSKAYEIDPKNPIVRIYRARLLEAVGQLPQAHAEYMDAIQVLPDNLVLQDQLAEYYIRQRQFPLAVKEWQAMFKEKAPGSVWAKAIFWNKVANPIDLNTTDVKSVQDPLEPLAEYYISLNPNEFWNDANFSKVSQGMKILTLDQSTLWLRLIQLLKDDKEKDALDLLSSDPFSSVSWNPDLEKTLKAILVYRNSGAFIPGGAHIAEGESKEPHLLPDQGSFFLNQMTQLIKDSEEGKVDVVISSDVKELILSKEAFAATFLAAAWSEVAIQLDVMPVIPSTFPKWVAYSMALAINNNRGRVAAIEYVNKQESTPTMQLLLGELYIVGGNLDAGLVVLLPLTKDDTTVGYRASWMVGLVYIDKKEYEKAKSAINGNKKLAKDNLGQEALARIALQQGDVETANKIYLKLENSSIEARSYLARKAFFDKDWARAKELTMQLINIFPENPTLKENLQKVNDEMKKANKS